MTVATRANAKVGAILPNFTVQEETRIANVWEGVSMWAAVPTSLLS